MDDEKDIDCPTGEDENGEGSDSQQQKLPWEGTDRDYTYEELLGRVFHTIRENNPELAADRRRTVMRPPQVLREGTKKTVFVNFMDLCKTYALKLLTFSVYTCSVRSRGYGSSRIRISG
ncbi:putative translation initiation factor IF2/IF5 [Helianthus annuus]|nr:putative translation initiation factor IF2/IF5 [Helianthus annuus]KAJ0624228.1 putative translation initiation factor IF2/IF5 [Helianthus annuus]KAJ0784334.1 putative translation initiation factor IF2/IF5 [Helianthus annuus]KAJ0793539.1 putative translation initiation factor IF2/IF5 [Helianthus annuus]